MRIIYLYGRYFNAIRCRADEIEVENAEFSVWPRGLTRSEVERLKHTIIESGKVRIENNIQWIEKY